MTTKDIIIILAPILIEGIIIFLFQLFISRKIDRIDRKTEVKDKVVEDFLNQVIVVSELHQNVLHNGVISESNLQILIDEISNLSRKYQANKAILLRCESEFDDYKTAWIRFGELWNNYNNDPENVKRLLEESDINCNECTIRLQKKLIAML